MDKELKQKLKISKSYIDEAGALLIVAGAGMGIDSGLPDYRGPQGLWNTWHPAAELNMKYEDLSTHETFVNNPELAWGFQTYLTKLYHDLDPHQGYYDLFNIASKKFNNNYFVITSNVDSQFLKSGFNPEQLYEVHGSKRMWQCMDKKCNKNHFPWEMDINDLPNIDPDTLRAIKPFPKCIHCGNMARPNVSFFGDFQFNEKKTKIQSGYLINWINKNKDKKLLIIEMGCGVSTHSIRFTIKNKQYTMLSNEWKLPKSFMGEQNTKMIRINPDETEEEGVLKIPYGAKKGIKLIKN